MSTESLNRASDLIENPSPTADKSNVVELDVLKQKVDNSAPSIKIKQVSQVSKRVDIEVLKQRLYEEKKKGESKKNNYSFFSYSFFGRSNDVNLLGFPNLSLLYLI